MQLPTTSLTNFACFFLFCSLTYTYVFLNVSLIDLANFNHYRKKYRTKAFCNALACARLSDNIVGTYSMHRFNFILNFYRRIQGCLVLVRTVAVQTLTDWVRWPGKAPVLRTVLYYLNMERLLSCCPILIVIN